MCLFFFQAEDGIRDSPVTGVQTCALPISIPSSVRIVEYITNNDFVLIKKLTTQFDNQLLYENIIKLFKVKANLSTSIGTLTLERPTILASGILGISLNVFERLHRAGAGAVVTKSLSKEPWDGYANPTIFSVKGDRKSTRLNSSHW